VAKHFDERIKAYYSPEDLKAGSSAPKTGREK